MRVILGASLLGSISLVGASPGLEKRAACNRDNCLRAVVAKNVWPYHSSASADCVSFMTATITPCPSTTTVTVYKTTTATTETDTDVVYITVTTTTTTTSTAIDSAVSGSSTESSSFQIPTGYAGKYFGFPSYLGYKHGWKRDADVKPNHIKVVGNVKRDTPAPMCPATYLPSSTPAYASKCSGAVRYSSACNCNGVPTGTTTLDPSTTTVYTTIYSTVSSTTATTTTTTVTDTSITSAYTTIFPPYGYPSVSSSMPSVSSSWDGYIVSSSAKSSSSSSASTTSASSSSSMTGSLVWGSSSTSTSSAPSTSMTSSSMSLNPPVYSFPIYDPANITSVSSVIVASSGSMTSSSSSGLSSSMLWTVSSRSSISSSTTSSASSSTSTAMIPVYNHGYNPYGSSGSATTTSSSASIISDPWVASSSSTSTSMSSSISASTSTSSSTVSSSASPASSSMIPSTSSEAAIPTFYYPDYYNSTQNVTASAALNTTTSTIYTTSTSSASVVSSSPSKTSDVTIQTQTTQPRSGDFICSVSSGGYIESNYTDGGYYHLYADDDSATVLYIDENGAIKAEGGNNFFLNIALTGNDEIDLVFQANYQLIVPDNNKLYCNIQNFVERSGSLACSSSDGLQTTWVQCGGSTDIRIADGVPAGCVEVSMDCEPWA